MQEDYDLCCVCWPRAQHYSVLGCLREQVEDLGAACKEEVFRRQAEAANDWRTDKELSTACEVQPLNLSGLRVRT